MNRCPDDSHLEGSELIDPGLEEEELQDMLLELYSEACY